MKNSIVRLHYITQEIAGRDLLHDIESACGGGVRWVQLRLKNKTESDVLYVAKKVKNICDKFSAVFIVNDYVNVAAEVGADGVHLGKQDMGINEAKKLLGKEKIIGASTNSFEDIVSASKLKVDYVGLGPFRFTLTKENLNPVLGLDGIRTIMKKFKNANMSIPVIGIGGIKLNDIEILTNAGLYGVAISSAINNQGDVKEKANEFVKSLDYNNKTVLSGVI